MKLLLDTHILIWLLEGNQNLNPKVKQVIEDETNSLYISIVSLWEIAIKTSLNKLQLELPLEKIICDFVLPSGIKILPIDIAHLLTLQNLPFNHRDPFDRLLIAQAKSETLTLVSEDSVFRQYQVNVLGQK
jgi:PIN domain nuclease of toxin-antitoxin system